MTSTMKHSEKSRIYLFLKPWLQEGLLLSKGKIKYSFLIELHKIIKEKKYTHKHSINEV